MRLAVAAQLLAVAALSLPAAASAKSTTGKPLVSTGPVTHVRGTTGTLTGSINPHGEATIYFFQYGPTTAYGQQTPTGSLPAGNTPVKVSQTVTGILPGYHYRLVASNNSKAEEKGKDRVYTPKATRLKFSITKPSGQHVIGGALVVAGSLTGTGAGNHRIALQANPYPFGVFTNVGTPILTDSAGRFSFHISNLLQTAQYRVVTVDPRPVISQVIVVPVSVRVTLHVRTSKRKGIVRLYGTVSPAEVGARVVFQIQKTPKKERIFKSEKAEERAEEKGPPFASVFVSVVKRATRTLSRFSKVVTIKKTGHYRAYVELRRGPLASGYSSTVTLHARPATKKRKAKRKKA